MRLTAVIVVLALAACAPPPAATYSPEVEGNFMRACESQSSIAGLCGCVWDKIEAEISPADFNALERLPGAEREGHALTAQINGYAMACGAQLAEEPAASP